MRPTTVLSALFFVAGAQALGGGGGSYSCRDADSIFFCSTGQRCASGRYSDGTYWGYCYTPSGLGATGPTSPYCQATQRTCQLPSGGFELDELTSCGGCPGDGTGVNCLEIPGVQAVQCLKDQCVAGTETGSQSGDGKNRGPKKAEEGDETGTEDGGSSGHERKQHGRTGKRKEAHDDKGTDESDSGSEKYEPRTKSQMRPHYKKHRKHEKGKKEVDPKNPHGKKYVDGKRDWTYSLFDFGQDMGLIFKAWCCMCFTYTEINQRRDYMDRKHKPMPDADGQYLRTAV
ncbi:priA protein precursor [Pseudohyphozyma bogoriensis]|nr:priA protein precursor [Pseudohyphozyma bogoriensis]